MNSALAAPKIAGRNETASIDVDGPVQALVDGKMAENREIRVLEAGAGSRSHIRLGPNSVIAGIDISQEQLDRNKELDEKIHGDLETYPLAPSSFDIIFCWDVVEHLKHPEKALQNFVRTIRPGGLIILGAPLVTSLKGTITKYTPHWFHVAVYKYLLGAKTAGKPGYGPFPTYLRYSIAPSAIERFAKQNDLTVEHLQLYEEQMQVKFRRKHRTIDIGYSIAGPLLKILSFGKIDPSVTDFIIVLRKNGTFVEDANAAKQFA
jgi:2-polyprenyl-3-methyl-5-hydroxy-6-metoxy-1,4-benzoquinol methylase